MEKFHYTEREKHFPSVPNDVTAYEYVWRDENISSSHHDALDPSNQPPVMNKYGQPDSGYSLLSTVSMTMTDRPAHTHTHNTDIDKGHQKQLLAIQKQTGSLSTLQNLLESSWMSAGLHRSILALGSEEMVTFGKPQVSDVAMSALLLYSPSMSLPIGRSQHNSLPPGGLKHMQHERELQVTNSQKIFQSGNIPDVLSQENRKTPELFTNEIPLPMYSFKQDSDKELHTRRLVEAQKSALHEQTKKISPTYCPSHLERLEIKENLRQMSPGGSQSLGKNFQSHRDLRQVNTPRRTEVIHRGKAGRKTVHWSSDGLSPRFDLGRSSSCIRNDPTQESSNQGGSSPNPKGPRKQDPLSSANQLHAAPQTDVAITDEEIAERFQALYRLRLLLWCFRRWCVGFGFVTKARLHHRRQTLSNAVFALQQAVLLQSAHRDTAERRHTALLLAQAFLQWKDFYERRQMARLDSDSFTKGHIAALRRRLVKASDTQPLRITFSAWRRPSQGQRIHRAAVIHHHLELVWKHWLLWRQAWLRQTSRAHQQLQAYVWREKRLCSKTWTTWLRVWQKRQRNTHLLRLVLQRWHQHVKKVRLKRLVQAAEQILSTRTLLTAFRSWKREMEMREATHSLCHLQDRATLQATFGTWMHRLQMVVQARKLQESRQKAHLARLFSAWRRLVLRRRLLVKFCRRQKILTVRSFFQNWSRALELRLLQKHVLILVFLKRQQTSQNSSAVQGENMAGLVVFRQDFIEKFSVEKLEARLVLQTAVYTWRERLKKQQIARWYHMVCVRERLRAGLLEWHRLTQVQFSDSVLSFRARLAQFHTPLSSSLLNSSGLGLSLDYTAPAGQQVLLEQCCNHSEPDTVLEPSTCLSTISAQREQRCPLQASLPLDKHNTREPEAEKSRDVEILSNPLQSFSHHCRGEAIVLRVLVRMMQPGLSLAFSQWRTLLHSSREMKQRAELFTNSRRLTGLRLALSTWTTRTHTRCRAVHHRERVLLSRSVSCWKKLMWFKRKEHQAIHLHQTRLIKYCFLEWHRQAECVLNSRQQWMEQRVERRHLSHAFTTWSARGRQQKAVRAFCTHTLLRRFFTAWQKCVQSHKESQAVALSFVQRRLCSATLFRWKSSWTLQQLANSRAKHTLHLSAKHTLQCWRAYTHNRVCMDAHLHIFVEWRERALKRRAFLIWHHAVEKSNRAQQFYQRVLLYRCFSKWLCVHDQKINLYYIFQELHKLRVQRLQRSAFSLWRQRLLHIHTQKQFLRMLIRRWASVCRSRRSARHQDQHLLTGSLQLWKQRVEMKRKRRETAWVAVQNWRLHVLQSREERERIQCVQRLKLSSAFLYWTRAAKQSLKSREHHEEKQRRRVLLAWHIHTVSAQRMRYSEAYFQYSVELRMMGSCFRLWRRALIQAQNRQCVLEEHLSLFHGRLTTQAFQRWKEATIQCSPAKKIHPVSLQKWFVCWKQQRDAHRTAKLFHAQKQKETARLALMSWSIWAKEHKSCRQMEEAVHLWLEGRRVCTVFHQWVKVYRQHKVAYLHSCKHLLYRVFRRWRTAVLETQQECQTAEMRLQRFQIQSAFRSWRKAAASHKTRAQKQHDLHLSEKYFSLWIQEVQRRQSERLLQARCRAKWLRCWRYRVVELREQRGLTRLYWASWKSQTAAMLLYSQQHEHEALQRAWLTWRKRRIRNRVVSSYTASLNRALLAKAFGVWCQRALVSGFVPSRAPTRSHSL